MTRRPFAFLVVGGLVALALVIAGSTPSELSAANKSSKSTKVTKKPIRNPKFDPTAEKVEMFPAADAGQIGIKLIPNDAMSGLVLVENKTDKPLTVKVPDAVVGVPVLGQFGGGGMGGMGGGMGGMGGMMGGMGGGMMGGGGGMMGGMGGGMFSIPPESVVSVPFKSVCLEHGKPEPNASNRYTLVPVAKFNSDPVLFQLLKIVSSRKVDPQAAQAAAWHLTNKMSFDELAAKTDDSVGGQAPYFTQDQLVGAQQLLAMAVDRAADDKSTEKSDEGADAEKSDSASSRRIPNN
jgi:hypothetical protein